MKSILRLLAALALAVWVAVPTFGNDGGDNAGGTGIWILPRASFLAAGPADISTRASKVLSNFSQDVVMQVSSECGACVATFADDLSGQQVSLQAYGGLVRVPATLLQALAASSSPKAHIVIVDASQLGYVMSLDRRDDGSLVLKVQ